MRNLLHLDQCLGEASDQLAHPGQLFLDSVDPDAMAFLSIRSSELTGALDERLKRRLPSEGLWDGTVMR